MADSSIGFGFDDATGRRLDILIEALRHAADTIPDQAAKDVEELVRKRADDAALRVLAEPTHGPKHTGLRARVSDGVFVAKDNTMSGSTITSLGSRMDGWVIGTSMPTSSEAIIPRGFDTRASGGRGWKHPLFADRSRWYSNYGGFSWFLGAMDGAQDDGAARLAELLDKSAEEIARM